MTRPPDSEEAKHRESLMDTGLRGTLEIESQANKTYKADWLMTSTFALAHPNSYIRTVDETYHGRDPERYRYGDPLPDIQWQNLTQIGITESQSIEATEKYPDLQTHASSIDTDDAPQVITYGPDESFWQSLSTFELARHDYIVFPELLSRRWTYGIPDLSCFRLGEFQQVLADIGIVPGGASLEEIEFRAKYDVYDSTQIDVKKTIGVVEAKREGSAGDGHRELTIGRNGNKPPYLDGKAIEKGWVVSPNATRTITANDSEVGGVTWESGESVYVEPPRHAAEPDAKDTALNDAKRVVLHTILQYQELPPSLRATTEQCLEEPEYLYDLFA